MKILLTLAFTILNCFAVGCAEHSGNPIILPGRLESAKIDAFSADDESLKSVAKRIDKIFFKLAPDFKSMKWFKPANPAEISLFAFSGGVDEKKVSFEYSGGSVLGLIKDMANENDLKFQYKEGNYILLRNLTAEDKKSSFIENRITCDEEVRDILRAKVEQVSASSLSFDQILNTIKSNIPRGDELVFKKSLQDESQLVALQEAKLDLDLRSIDAYNVVNILIKLLEAEHDIKLSVEVSIK